MSREEPKRITLKDGSVRYRKRIDLGRDPVTGKRIQRLVTAPTKDAWRAEATKARADALRGVGQGTDPDLTVERFLLRRWLPDKEASGAIGPASAHKYERICVRQIVPALGHVRLTRLRPADVQRFYTALRERYAPNTVLGVHSVLDAALAHATRLELIQRNPCEAVSAPRPPDEPAAVWTLAEARTFLAGAANDRDAALWMVLLLGGLRVGEAIALSLGRRGSRQWLPVGAGHRHRRPPRFPDARRPAQVAARPAAGGPAG